MDGKQIFIVDDDPLVTTLVAKRLEAAGYKAKSFAYGEDCIAALDSRPDLIILDYYFVREGTVPMNGMQIFDEIHNLAPGLPVVMLSAQESGELVLEFARKGIAEYVVKDANLAGNLLNVIKEILGI